MSKRKRWFATAPVRKLMKVSGARIVSVDGVNFLLEWLAEQATTVTKKALTLAHHAKRVKVTKGDIKLAIGL